MGKLETKALNINRSLPRSLQQSITRKESATTSWLLTLACTYPPMIRSLSTSWRTSYPARKSVSCLNFSHFQPLFLQTSKARTACTYQCLNMTIVHYMPSLSSATNSQMYSTTFQTAQRSTRYRSNGCAIPSTRWPRRTSKIGWGSKLRLGMRRSSPRRTWWLIWIRNWLRPSPPLPRSAVSASPYSIS